ncbi:MAG: hypothetical protein KAJ44_00180 [Thermoplasmatales archaeon]|nr:hypothetical protein [Thermoplasmatales archaeon]
MNYHIDVLPFSISKNHPYKFDKNGVILSKIPYTQEYHYHTTSIASYAIKNSDNPKIFDPQIRWLVNNIDQDGAYRQNFTFPHYYNFPKPWIGGLCQGLAISALIKAYKKYDKKTYLDTAKKAFNCLNRDIEDEGCIFTDRKGEVWIEEYPVCPHILNGFIYALFGIYDLYKETKNKEIKNLFDGSIQTITTNLKNYDMGFWSLYDLAEKLPATEFYHTIHIKQLNALYKITGNEILQKYGTHWKNAANNSRYRSKANRTRTMSIVKKHGIIDSIKRYYQRRQWLHG